MFSGKMCPDKVYKAKKKERAEGLGRGSGRRGGERGMCKRRGERGVYSKKPISCNAKPSSDAPQTKQTKHLIRPIVRDIPQLNVCALMRARCVVNMAQTTDTETRVPGEFAQAQVCNNNMMKI